MSAPACTLTLTEVDELTECLDEQRAAIVLIMTEADAARNGVGVDWQRMYEALGRVATSITTIDDTISHRTHEGANADERSAGDGR